MRTQNFCEKSKKKTNYIFDRAQVYLNLLLNREIILQFIVVVNIARKCILHYQE